MLEEYTRQARNAQGLKVLSYPAIMPPVNLCVGLGDEEMSSIPLMIFRQQGTVPNVPVFPEDTMTDFYDSTIKGNGVVVGIQNFVTDDFGAGVPIG